MLNSSSDCEQHKILPLYHSIDKMTQPYCAFWAIVLISAFTFSTLHSSSPTRELSSLSQGCASALVARQYLICTTNVASLMLPVWRSDNAFCKRGSMSLYVAVHPSLPKASFAASNS